METGNLFDIGWYDLWKLASFIWIYVKFNFLIYEIFLKAQNFVSLTLMTPWMMMMSTNQFQMSIDKY